MEATDGQHVGTDPTLELQVSTLVVQAHRGKRRFLVAKEVLIRVVAATTVCHKLKHNWSVSIDMV